MRVVCNYIRCIYRRRCNIDKNNVGVLACLDKDVVARFYEGMVACLDEGVVECLDNNNKDEFDDNFFLAQPLVQLLEGTLGGQCIVYHVYMNKIGWSET